VASSRLEVDLGAIERNLGIIRRVTTPAEPEPSRRAEARPGAHRVAVCAVLKQDGYGTGALRIAKRLAAAGVELIAVYSLDEARVIAEGVPGVNILVLMPVHGVDRHDPLYRHASSGRVHLTLHGLEQFGAVQEMAGRIGAQIPLHLQVDTGLSRGGAMPDEAAMLLERVIASPKVRLGGLMTHFSSPCCDDAFTREQARTFRDFVEKIRPAIKQAVDQGGRAVARVNELVVHAANSCATFRSRAYHGTMVRVGQSVLGYVGDDVPRGEQFEFRAEMESLEPSVRWVSGVAHVQEIPAGWPVGYGSTWRAPARADGRRTKIALIPVGYADGYPRSLGGRGSGGPGAIAFTGRAFERRAAGDGDAAQNAADSALPTIYAPVVGRVSMDQITVDVTDVPEQYLKFTQRGTETCGPEVEIYSREPGTRNYLSHVADCAGTITHDLLCRISPRVERVYRTPLQLEAARERAGADASARLGAPIRTNGGLGGAAAVAR
jgi:alanine racemase